MSATASIFTVLNFLFMTEELLHHLWKFRLFNQFELKTTEDQPLEIIKVGEHNGDAGPDFFNARIRIGDTIWVGNIEVHIHSGDWEKHRHQSDKAYDNIILHVVFQADHQIYRASGEPIPTLELKDRIAPSYYQTYLKFKSSKDWIPCEKQVHSVPSLIVNSMLDRLLVERLEERSVLIRNMLALNKMNWEETFYQLLARNFGFKTNALPFELLSKSLSSIILAKHKSSLLQVEALLFGQAGFLDTHFRDRYAQQLQNEYVFLKQKFKLVSINNHLWKFLRLRPVNFPTVRIAQFSFLIHRSSNLFSKMIEASTVEELKELMNTGVSTYWNDHYVFEKRTAYRSKKLGEEAIHNIIVNTVVPVLFIYGKAKGEERYMERAIGLMEELEGESNSVISRWSTLNMRVACAGTTQALLQLKNKYCDQKRCLQCGIGNYLLKKV
jgi:hypothetical protein